MTGTRRFAAACSLALALAIPLAFGAPRASAETTDGAAPDVAIPADLLTASPAALDPTRHDPDARLSLIVRLSGPPLWDLYQAARDRAGAKDTDAVVPLRTLETLHDAIEARQTPARAALGAIDGVKVIDSFQVIENGFLVHATRRQIPAIARVPGVVAIHRAPVWTVDMDKAGPHVGATRVREELKYDGTGTIVAVIDTGIDYMHAAFGGEGSAEAFQANDPTFAEPDTFPTKKVVGGVDLAGSHYGANCPPQVPEGVACDPEPNPDDDPLDEMYLNGAGGQGHGSHVSGIVASEGTTGPTGKQRVPPGIAPGARLVGIKVFGNPTGMPAGFQGSTDLASGGMEWVVEHNLGMDVQGWPVEDDAGNRQKINVMNMSLGSPFGGGMAEANDLIERAVASGVTVIASSGNAGNVPYITGSPGAAAMAVSVASSFAAGESGVGKFLAAWDGGNMDTPSVDAAPELAPPFTELEPYVDMEMAWYGLACNNPDGTPSTPTQEINEKVALIQRGTCPFTQKFINAAKLGARAVVIFSDDRPPVPMGGSCWPEPHCAEIPGVMIGKAEGQQLQGLLEGGTVVKASFPVEPAEQLTDTISDFSSRGPDRARGGVKPQITGPGSNILSVWAGSGTGSLSISGTSMSGPLVAGVAALLWERRAKENLDLAADDISALLLNYADMRIHAEGNNANPLVGVSRQGAGLVNAYASAMGDTIVRTEGGIAELGFAEVFAGEEPSVTTRKLTIKNIGTAAKTYKLSSSFVAPDEDGNQGVSLAFEPSQVKVEPGQSASVDAMLTADPSKLRSWTLPGQIRSDATVSVANFQTFEIDGQVHVTEVDAAGAPVAGGDVAHVPFSSLPQRASCVDATTKDPIVFEGAAAVDHTFANPCFQPGGVANYLRLGTDAVEPHNPGELNIANVGVRWFDFPDRDPNHPETALQVVEFAVQTTGARRLPLSTEFHVYFDTDMDGKFDRVGWNLQVNGGRYATVLGDMLPGTLNPNPATAFDANGSTFAMPQAYNIGETTTVLRFWANHPVWGIGKDLARGDAVFNFAVSLADAAEDHPIVEDGDFLGYDEAPDNMSAGLLPGIDADEAFTFDQRVVDCVRVTDAGGQPVPGLPELVSVTPRTGRTNLKLAACTGFEPTPELAVMMHYPYNMPGGDLAIRPFGMAPGAIYLPLAQQSHELVPATPVPAEPTAEPTPTP